MFWGYKLTFHQNRSVITCFSLSEQFPISLNPVLYAILRVFSWLIVAVRAARGRPGHPWSCAKVLGQEICNKAQSVHRCELYLVLKMVFKIITFGTSNCAPKN